MRTEILSAQTKNRGHRPISGKTENDRKESKMVQVVYNRRLTNNIGDELQMESVCAKPSQWSDEINTHYPYYTEWSAQIGERRINRIKL